MDKDHKTKLSIADSPARSSASTPHPIFGLVRSFLRIIQGLLYASLQLFIHIAYMLNLIITNLGRILRKLLRPALAPLARTKLGSRLIRHYRATHHRIAHRPHQHLMAKSNLYNRWHSWQYKWLHHGHVHGATTVAAVLTMTVMVINSLGNVYALSTWSQSDWSGGQGSSTSNQYANAMDIDTTVAGEAKLQAGANIFQNPSFDGNIASWNGLNKVHDTTTKYNGSGSAKVTAGSVSSNIYYGPNTISTGTSSLTNITSGDINNDGIDDVVIGNQQGTDPNLRLQTGDGEGGLSSPTLLSTGSYTQPFDPKIQDINGDGWSDIITSYYVQCSVFSVWLNNGNGGFLPRSDYLMGHCGGLRTCSIAVDRFNNDIHYDIALNCGNSTFIEIWLNNGSGGFTAKTDYSKGGGISQELISVDINGDSRKDLIWPHGSNASPICSIYYILNNGSGFEPPQSYTYSNCGGWNIGGYHMGSGDFNKDGYGDVAACRYNGGVTYITTLFGSSSGLLSSQADYQVTTMGQTCPTEKVVVSDVNSDTNMDIIYISSYMSVVGVLLNNGNGTFTHQATTYTVGSSPTSLTVGNFNGDNIPDAIASGGSILTSLVNRSAGDAITQAFAPASINQYSIEGYVYTNGSVVTSGDVELIYNGIPVATAFAPTTQNGWYKVSGVITADTSRKGYGVLVKRGKTAYIDDMKLYKFATSGNLTSNILDLGYGGDWGVLSYTTDKPSFTVVKVRTSNDPGMAGAPAFAGCAGIASGTDLTGQSCVTNNHRYVQYQVTLNVDSGTTPTLQDVAIQYDPWDTDPPDTNASNLSMKKSAGGSSVTSGGWTNGSSPYFEWDTGADNSGGSGIKGYCLYLGQDNTANPVTTKGLLGTSPVNTEGACQFAVSTANIDLATSGYIQTALTSSNTPYYLNVKALDNAGNVFAGSSAQFSFRFDNTPPTNPAFISAPSQFVASKNVTLTWPTSGGDAASDTNSGLDGLQYKIANTSWYGDSHSGSQDNTDLLANDGSYTTASSPDYPNLVEGNNIVHFRTWDQAGNVSATSVTTVIKLNTSSPSSPQNLAASPTSNTTNSFAFSWAAPSSFQGSASNLTYCYSVNTLPSNTSCSFTAAGVTSLPAGAYATQPGANTLYLVAKDEAGNINYATAASETFTANTAAPGIPLNVDIADVSIKTSSTWRLALSWNEPTDTGAGIASYRIERSTNGINFSQVATTSGTSHVDGSLSSQKYYYRIKACDSANNCGANSAVVADTPTGKFTEPASLVDAPSVTVSTRTATIRWVTDRTSDSRIQYGLSSGTYFATEAATSEQTKVHTIKLSNLDAGTTYHYKARWTDEDGNTGSSGELAFTTLPAPKVKDVKVTRVTTSTANIMFTVKDASQVKFVYGKSDNFGGLQVVNTSRTESSYTVELNGLDDGASYSFGLNPVDSEGNEYKTSQINTFTTPARPRITNLAFQPVTGEPTSTQQVTWTTNVPTTSLVRFAPKDGVQKELSDSALVTEHKVILRDLLDDTEYTLTAESRDAGGNLAVSDAQKLKTALDTRSPKVSNVKVETVIRGTGAEARGQIVVSWKTDEPATSQVAYGEGSGLTKFNNRTSEDAALATEHIVIISDLPTSRVFSVQPLSADRSRNSGQGVTKSAIIGKASDSVITIVLNSLKGIFGF